jgi:hypothetical protein
MAKANKKLVLIDSVPQLSAAATLAVEGAAVVRPPTGRKKVWGKYQLAQIAIQVLRGARPSKFSDIGALTDDVNNYLKNNPEYCGIGEISSKTVRRALKMILTPRA